MTLGEGAAHAAAGDAAVAETALRRYRDWFEPRNSYVELQQDLDDGDTARNAVLAGLARGPGLGIVATGVGALCAPT